MKFPYQVWKQLAGDNSWLLLREFRTMDKAEQFQAKLVKRFRGTYKIETVE